MKLYKLYIAIVQLLYLTLVAYLTYKLYKYKYIINNFTLEQQVIVLLSVLLSTILALAWCDLKIEEYVGGDKDE